MTKFKCVFFCFNYKQMFKKKLKDDPIFKMCIVSLGLKEDKNWNNFKTLKANILYVFGLKNIGT